MPTKTIAWTTGTGNITLTYTGQGDGTILVSSDDNTGAARSQTITIQTTAGTPVVTRTVTINQAAYVPPVYNFSYTGTVQSCTLPAGTYRLQCWGAQGSANAADSTYGITSQAGGKGGYSEGTLVLTQQTTLYIFVGGQPTSSDNHGGWNGGGGNSGTSTSGAATDSAGLGYTKMGKGGGGTDIALVTSTMDWSTYKTERSSASLLSRFIVAGGGSGGAMALKRKTTSTSRSQVIANAYTILMSSQPDSPLIINVNGVWQDATSIGNYATKIIDVSAYAGMACYFTISTNTYYAFLTASPVVGQSPSYAGGASGQTWGSAYKKNIPSDAVYLYISVNSNGSIRTPSDISINSAPDYYALINSSNKWQEISGYGSKLIDVTAHRGRTCSFSLSASSSYAFLAAMPVNGQAVSYAGGATGTTWASSVNKTIPSDASYLYIFVNNNGSLRLPGNITISWTESQTTDTYESQVGYAGGGIEGVGNPSGNYGTQNSAGNNAGFGYGSSLSSSSYRYASAGGGGGWYGGGSTNTNTDNIGRISYSGGGSGFVNTSANSQYRPTGYTGLELSDGSTYAGNTSFPSTTGSLETGHEGNGYARITRAGDGYYGGTPLTFDIITSGNIGWKTSNANLATKIQYKKNNGSWTTLTPSTSGVTVSVSAGDKIAFRCNANATAFANSSRYCYFTATCTFNAYGNIMSLYNQTQFEFLKVVSVNYYFKCLFRGCTGLKDASKIVMPETYSTYCFYQMFYGCTGMTKSPALLGATLTNYCCYQMYYNCSSLTWVKNLATSRSASSCLSNWMSGVSATGTFVKKSGESWTSGASGIPSGWTVQEV